MGEQMRHSIVSITHDLFVVHLSNVARMQRLIVSNTEEYLYKIDVLSNLKVFLASPMS